MAFSKTGAASKARIADPRLIFGLVLILVSAISSWLLFTQIDEQDSYWALSRSIDSGERVQQSDFVEVRAQVPPGAGFLQTTKALDADLSQLTWARSIEAGAMVTTSDFLRGGGDLKAEVPLNVALGSFPADLSVGDQVDIWVTAPADSGLYGDAERVMTAVRVVGIGGEDLGVGSTVVVGLTQDPTGSQLGIIAAGEVMVVRVR